MTTEERIEQLSKEVKKLTITNQQLVSEFSALKEAITILTSALIEEEPEEPGVDLDGNQLALDRSETSEL